MQLTESKVFELMGRLHAENRALDARIKELEADNAKLRLMLADALQNAGAEKAG